MRSKRLSTVATVLGALVLIGALALVLSFNSLQPAAAQTTGQAAQTSQANLNYPRTITVVGEGIVNVSPDIARTTIGVETSGQTVRAATDEASTVMQNVLDAITGAGVDSKDIQTSGYSIFVDRGTVEPSSTITQTNQNLTYRVNNSVSVTIRDLNQVGAVLDAAINAGANNVFGVDFSVDNDAAAMSQARRIASENARARAEELASLNGVGVGEVLSISEIIQSAFMPVAARAGVAEGMGGGAGPIAPGQQQVTAQLQVVYALVPGTGTAGATRTPGATVTRTATSGAGATGTPEATTTATSTGGTTATAEAIGATAATAETTATTGATTTATTAGGTTSTPGATATP